MSLRTAHWLFALEGIALVACGRQIELGRELASGLGGQGGSGGHDAGPLPCETATCQGKTYACGDCLDNDGDGLLDSLDPECLGPCDSTEETFFDRAPGANDPPCKQDCYFDADMGSGNDGCHWSLACDPLYQDDANCPYSPSASVPGTSLACAALAAGQSETCRDYCLPLAPHGCDCFGCCELPAESGRYVWIGSSLDGVGTCDLASIADPTRCHPCTPVASCLNPCTPGEVCIGRLNPVPSGSTQCPNGRKPCGLAGQEPCGDFEYCLSGCCVAEPA